VKRRFMDGSSPTVRYACTLLERCLSYSCSVNDFDAVMKAVVEDRLLPGRAVARVLYVPTFSDEEDAPSADADQDNDNDEFEESEEEGSVIDNPGDEESEPVRKVVDEKAFSTYVFWEDYREGPARQWKEVPWVRYKSYLMRDELTERFGKEKGK